MTATPVYIICSPRPQVGKTLVARLVSEFLLLKNGTVTSFDINLKEPSLLDYLPKTNETGFMKEAARRGIAPIILFMADTDRVSGRGYEMLQRQIPAQALVAVDN